MGCGAQSRTSKSIPDTGEETAASKAGVTGEGPQGALKLDSPCKVLIGSINDVYLTDNIPKFCTLADTVAKRESPDHIFLTHAGDFLSPSPLSNFDKGLNMIHVLNEAGLTHITLGNHEFDIALPELKARLQSLTRKTKIVCSNVEFPSGSNADYNVVKNDISILQPQGIKIGWIGLLTPETVELLKAGGLYSKYEGLEVTDPIESAKEQIAELNKEGVHAIILLTHLSVKQDKLLAEEAAKHGIKLILGGHDHNKIVEQPHGVHLIKSGYDAIEASFVTLTFNADAEKKAQAQSGEGKASSGESKLLPHEVDVKLLNVSEVKADDKAFKKMVQLVEAGNKKLKALGSTLLIPPPKCDGKDSEKVLLSSKNPRNAQCTVGRLFCDILKRFFQADVAIVNSGKIRNKSDYPKGLTLTDVGAELPFKDNFTYMEYNVFNFFSVFGERTQLMFVRGKEHRLMRFRYSDYQHLCHNIRFPPQVKMTGKEIEEVIVFSYKEKLGQGGFLAYDNGLEFDEKEKKLTSINCNTSFVKDNLYSVVVPISLLNGMDGVLPLAKIGEREKTKEVSLDHLMLLQDIVIKQCVFDQWEQLNVTACDFKNADKNNNSLIEHEEFVEFLKASHPEVSGDIINMFWESLDEDGNGALSEEEFLRKTASKAK
eukprot:jgi/Bigna1/141566/aug1.63_g16274